MLELTKPGDGLVQVAERVTLQPALLAVTNINFAFSGEDNITIQLKESNHSHQLQDMSPFTASFLK